MSIGSKSLNQDSKISVMNLTLFEAPAPCFEDTVVMIVVVVVVPFFPAAFCLAFSISDFLSLKPVLDHIKEAYTYSSLLEFINEGSFSSLR